MRCGCLPIGRPLDEPARWIRAALGPSNGVGPASLPARLPDEPRGAMNVPTDVTAALAAEFAMPGASVLLVSGLRLLLAAVLGGAIGYEREKKERSAGLKTHILVSVGSALYVMAPLYAGVSQADNTRVVQGVVSGIGFLGAGAILKLQRDMRVEGLTTAASIWLTSAIGVAAGLGNALLAIIATGVALFVTAVIPRLVPDGGRK